MKYNVVVHFKDHDETFNGLDGYSHANSVLALFNYCGNKTTIKLFPLTDISSVDIEQVGA